MVNCIRDWAPGFKNEKFVLLKLDFGNQSNAPSMTLETLKKSLKKRYKNGPDNIGADFIAPCMKEAVLFRRGTAFFSSGAMLAWASSLEHLISGKLRIEIICSPVVRDIVLLEALATTKTDEERRRLVDKLSTRIVLSALGLKSTSEGADIRPADINQYKRDLLAYFLAKGIITLKFAIPKDLKALRFETDQEVSSDLLYHVKTGYFLFSNGEKVAFEGSFNESQAGHSRHIEHTLVFRSWSETENELVRDISQDIDDDWNEKNPYISVYPLSAEALELVANVSPRNRPSSKPGRDDKDTKGSEQNVLPPLRDYQIAAIDAWKAAGNTGIFAMATGSGKTRTAIELILRFRAGAKNGLTIVTVPYRPLANQWIGELKKAGIDSIRVFDEKAGWLERVTNLFHLHMRAGLDTAREPVLVCVNRSFVSDGFQSLLRALPSDVGHRLLIVDECHHFNKKNWVAALPINFKFRVGLSATPYENDEVRYLERYFGDIIFEFSLRDAIARGYLCPYYYEPIMIEFSDSEAKRYVDLTRQIFTRQESDTDDVSTELGCLDEVLEGVIAKFDALNKVIAESGPTPHTLFYVGGGSIEGEGGERLRQLEALARNISTLGWRVSKITCSETSDERNLILQRFQLKDIDAIVSIRILDEGIDIPECQTAFILASQRSERSGIQRRGRLLRRSEGKTAARLYDFILVGPHSSERSLSLLYERELKRARLFAEDAINRSECLMRIDRI